MSKRKVDCDSETPPNSFESWDYSIESLCLEDLQGIPKWKIIFVMSKFLEQWPCVGAFARRIYSE